MASESQEAGLENLLDLHGYTAEVGGGFWISMKCNRIPPDAGRPHGIQYALSLHRPGNDRVLGYDNAHQPQIGTGPARKSKRRELWFDHKHSRDRVLSYEFVSPAQLLMDFWADVEAILKEEGIP